MIENEDIHIQSAEWGWRVCEEFLSFLGIVSGEKEMAYVGMAARNWEFE